MSKPAKITIHNDRDRAKARKWIDAAPKGYTVHFKPTTRSDPQSRRMYALLDDVADQKEWAGKKRTRYGWKDLFSASLRGQELVPNLDGDGFVAFGAQTSEFSPEEMSDMITLIEAWGANHGVVFTDQPQESLVTATTNEGDRAGASDTAASTTRGANPADAPARDVSGGAR